MTLLATVPPPVRRFALAAGLLATLAARGAAQTELSHTEDAAPVPRGMLRLRVTNAWTRWDQRYDANGLHTLGDELSADPLGTAQFPLLASIESSIQALAADPRTRLSLGRLVTRGDARVVTTPVVLELGVTSRLSVGVVVPVVQTRRTISVSVNDASGTPANVGFVAPANRATAAAANASAAASYTLAATQLADLIARCQAAPSGTGCAAVNSDPAGAAAARTQAERFAAAARALGTDTASTRIAPRAQGSFAVEIELQRNALNRQLQQYLGAGGAQGTPVYFAPTDFSYIDLQGRNGTPGLLQSQLAGGLDSLHTTERIGIGDVSVGAQLLVFDAFQHDTLPLRPVQARLAIGGAVRFATSRADTAASLIDIGTGDGAGVEVRSALDLIVGRVGGTVAARYVKSFAREVSAPLFGDPEASFTLPTQGRRERTAGDVLGIDITPRYLLSESFAIDTHYGVERTGAVTWGPGTPAVSEPPYCAVVSCATPVGSARIAQRVGIGLRYSTVDSYARGRSPFPVEASYTHLETISGDPGVAKLAREQIQVRLFYRLFGR